MRLIVASEPESWCWAAERSPGALLCFNARPDSQHFDDGDLISPGMRWPRCMPADSLQRHLPPPSLPPPCLSHQPAPFLAEAHTSLCIGPDFDSYHGRPLLVSDGLNDSIYLIKYRSCRGMLRMGLGSGKGEWSVCVCVVRSGVFQWRNNVIISSQENNIITTQQCTSNQLEWKKQPKNLANLFCKCLRFNKSYITGE